MAGRGPAPKHPSKRARTNKDPVPFKDVQVERAKQPPLPKIKTGEDDYGDPVYFEWPEVTRRWWRRWSRSPMAVDFTEDDWDELLVAARLHARFWQGDDKVAAELRQRVAKFGATPEDRARLRVQYVVADDAERKSRERTERDESRPAASADVRQKYGPLRAV